MTGVRTHAGLLKRLTVQFVDLVAVTNTLAL